MIHGYLCSWRFYVDHRQFLQISECFQIFTCVISIRVTIVHVNPVFVRCCIFLYNTCGFADGDIYIYIPKSPCVGDLSRTCVFWECVLKNGGLAVYECIALFHTVFHVLTTLARCNSNTEVYLFSVDVCSCFVTEVYLLCGHPCG